MDTRSLKKKPLFSVYIFKQFSRIVKHKYDMMLACFKCGLIWQGLTHDLSKFSPVEFFRGVRYFAKGSSPIGVEKTIEGHSIAWQHHRGRNKHHWEYWTDFNYGKLTLLRMPPKYLSEMLCEWVVVNKAHHNMDKLFPWTIDELKQYYEECKNHIYLHKSTKAYVDMLMNHVKSEEDLFENWISIPRILENYCLDEIEGCAYQEPLTIWRFIGIDLAKESDQ